MKIAQLTRTLLLASAPLFLAACGSAQAPAPSFEHCQDVGVEAHQIWNQSLKTELNFPAKIYAGNLAAGEAEFVVRNLDKFVSDWQSERQLACLNDPKPHNTSGGASRKSPKVQCLDRALANFQILVNEIKASRDLEYARFTEIFDELSGCAGRAIPPALELKLSPFENDTDSSSDTDDLFWEEDSD